MKKTILFTLACIISPMLISCTDATAQNAQNAQNAPASEKLTPTARQTPNKAQANQEQALWIDVRTQAEYDAGHLPNAILIPYNEIAARIESVAKDKKATINLYCRSGSRAGVAKQMLEELGYTHVVNRGAYDRLKEQIH